jgi:hypothetical protein
MSDNNGGFFSRVFEACLLICGAVLLLYVAIQYLLRMWWILVILAGVVAGLVVLISWLEARNNRW